MYSFHLSSKIVILTKLPVKSTGKLHNKNSEDETKNLTEFAGVREKYPQSGERIK
ncbi:hypothetical protein HispidOSU_021961, partial [Sigmodon hispidus]